MAGLTALQHYAGGHEFRVLGGYEEFRQSPHDYWYDPAKDTAHDIFGRIVGDWQPDLFISWMPEEFPPPRYIEHAPVRTVAAVSDWNLYYTKMLGALPRFDVTASDWPGSQHLALGTARPAYFGPLYSHKTGLHEPMDLERDLDVVYVGGFNHVVRPERGQYLARLAAMSDRYRIFLGEGFFGQEYTKLLNRARIVFNHAIRGEMNLRLFETMACGGVPFLEETNEEARRCLEDGVDVVYFNENNFEERITHYLEHEEAAQAIIKRGRERAREFAGHARLGRFADWAMNQPGSGRPYHRLPPREQAYRDVLMYSGSYLSAARQVENGLMRHFAAQAPDDARAWSCIAAHVANGHLNAYLTANVDAKGKEACLKALQKARALAPDSACHAMNLAWGHAWLEDAAGERAALEDALDLDGMDGAEQMLGNIYDAFWVPWMYGVARGKTDAWALHAEAHARLALLDYQSGQFESAEESLRCALDWAPGHYSAKRLLAEVCVATGRRKEACDLIRQHIAFRPFDYAARSRLETLLKESGEEQAAAQLELETARLRGACVAGQG